MMLTGRKHSNWIDNAMIEEIKNIKQTKRDFRNFGLTMGIVLGVIGAVLFFKSSSLYPWFWAIGGLFIFLGLLLPSLLKPLYWPWMIFAVILGWFMTRLILAMLFYLVITPIGLITRLLGKLSIEIRWKQQTDSYWSAMPSGVDTSADHEKQY